MSVSVNLTSIATADAAPRKRVRTPGKHIVLFSLAVTFMLALSTTALQSGRVRLPSYSQPGSDEILYAPVEEFLIDLAPDAIGRSAFLKLSAKMVAKDAAALSEIKEKRPMIRERVSFFLRELSADDFAGSEAMARVKAELLKRAQLPLSDGAVADVIVEDMVIQ